MSTLCIRCGFDNPPGMRFCGNCGNRLDTVAEPKPGAPAPAGESVDQLGVLMGADLIERMRHAGLEARGQRRNVTVLFVDLTGFTMLSSQIDGEDLFEVTQRFIRMLVNDVYRYEGIVDKLTGDGLMALFGAPISHENNAERAVHTAQDMQNDLTELNRELRQELGIELSARVGIHSGAVIVGGVGSDMMMDYTAIGDTVNLARRIEEAAPPGAILVSDAVYRQVRAFFDCQQISILNPKGIAHPVIAYRVINLKLRPGAVRGLEALRAPMIGRDREIERLKEIVRALTDEQRGCFALITGEAGLGKSRLTAELRASLDQGAVRVLQGQSLAYRRTVSYWIIREILHHYLGIQPGMSPQQIGAQLNQSVRLVMGNQGDEALPYLEHLLSLPFSDPSAMERLRHLDAGQLRQQIFLAVRDLFLAEANLRPLLIIVDDLHWADEASLELLQFLLESLRRNPLFILAISRTIVPGTLEKVVAWAEYNLSGRFEHIQLQNLSFDQSDQLLNLLLSIPNLPEELRQQILQRAAGNPFYLEEILRMLIDQGAIRSDGNRWQIAPGADVASLGVPETLQQLILARFDRLTNVQKNVMQVASVIGKDFSLPVLGEAFGAINVATLQAVVDSLEERDFIMPRPGGSADEYTFRHILMSDTVYGTLLRKERSELHGRVADVIETKYADRLDEQVELLANHYLWSPRQDRALHYLILAGEKAARNHIYAQSRHHFQSALETLPKVDAASEQVLRVHMGLGDALAFLGEYPEARAHFQTALEAVPPEDRPSRAEERSSLFRKIARTYERKGDYDQALYHLNCAEQALDASQRAYPVERAEIRHDIGWIHFRRGNFAEAGQFLQGALELVEATEAYSVIASIYNRLGPITYYQGECDQALSYLRKSVAIREAIGDVVGLASSSNNLGYMEVEMGEYDNALQDLTRNLELVTRLGQVEGIAIALNNLGWLRIQRGEVDEAEKNLNEALELAGQIGYSSLIREVRKNIGELYLATENWQKAQEVLAEVLPSFEEIGANDQLMYAYRLLGEAALGASDMPKALTWASKVEELAAQLGSTELSAIQKGALLRFRGMLATCQADWEAAEQHFQESAAIFQKLRSRLYLGHTVYQHGILAEVRGDRNKARSLYLEAAQLFRQIGARLEVRRSEDAYRRLLTLLT